MVFLGDCFKWTCTDSWKVDSGSSCCLNIVLHQKNFFKGCAFRQSRGVNFQNFLWRVDANHGGASYDTKSASLLSTKTFTMVPKILKTPLKFSCS